MSRKVQISKTTDVAQLLIEMQRVVDRLCNYIDELDAKVGKVTPANEKAYSGSTGDIRVGTTPSGNTIEFKGKTGWNRIKIESVENIG